MDAVGGVGVGSFEPGSCKFKLQLPCLGDFEKTTQPLSIQRKKIISVWHIIGVLLLVILLFFWWQIEDLIVAWREETFPSKVLLIPLPISLACDSKCGRAPCSQNQNSGGKFWYVHTSIYRFGQNIPKAQVWCQAQWTTPGRFCSLINWCCLGQRLARDRVALGMITRGSGRLVAVQGLKASAVHGWCSSSLALFLHLELASSGNAYLVLCSFVHSPTPGLA